MDNIDDPSRSATAAAEHLAAEFIDQRDAGEQPDVEAWAAKLSGKPERELFRTFVKDAQMAEGILPSQLRSGVLVAGRYRIVREIGSGGMGKVFSAMDEQLKRPVALKVLAAFASGSFDPEQLFMKESRLLAGLKHPNIVAVHEASNDGDVRYIVMDLVDGRSIADLLVRLRERLPPGKHGQRAAPKDGAALARALDLPVAEGSADLIDPDSWWRTVAQIMVEVVRTVEAAHGQGVIHRDLKPANIMLRGGASPVVLDFGLAGTIDTQGGLITQGLFGSVAYLAPEQARHSKVGTDPRTDIYQLGLVLYEFITLRRAFKDDGITAMLEKISRGEFRRPRAIDPQIPMELEAICLMATELSPDRRYDSARKFREDLERYVEGNELPLAVRAGVGRRSRYFMRRHRVASLAAAAVIVGSTIGFLGFSGDEQTAAMFEPYRFSPVANLAEGIAGTPSEGLTGEGDVIRENHIMGVRLHTKEPKIIYALSVFGERNPPTWVVPTKPEIHLSNPEGLVRKEWGLRVEAGVNDVNCSRVNTLDNETSYEGMLVFASNEPNKQIEAWLNRLEQAGQNEPAGRVSYALARQLFDNPSLGSVRGDTRGGSPTTSPEEAEVLQQRLQAEDVFANDDSWPYFDPQRYQHFYLVQRDAVVEEVASP